MPRVDLRTLLIQVQFNSDQAARKAGLLNQAVQATGASVTVLSKALKDAEKNAERAANAFSNMAKSMKGAALSAGFAISGLSYATGRATEGIFSLGKALVEETATTAAYGLEVRRQADALGITTDQYQELAFAAKKYGVEMKKIEDVLVMLSSRSLQAQEGNKTQAGNFALLGISQKDLKGKSPVQLLYQMADAIKAGGDATKRLAAAQRILGNANAKVLIPLLRQGSRGFREMALEAKKLGLIMSEDDIKASERFSRQMLILQSDFDVFKRTLSLDLMPALTDWGKTFDNIYQKVLKPVADHINGRLVIAVGALAISIGAVTTALLALLGATLLAMPVFTGLAGILVFAGLATGVTELAGVLAILFVGAVVSATAVAAVFLGTLAAIGLAIDDIATYSRGGKSFVGEFFAEFENQDTTLGAAARLLKAIVEWLIQYNEQSNLAAQAMRGFQQGIDQSIIQPIQTAIRWLSVLADALGLKDRFDALADQIRGPEAQDGPWAAGTSQTAVDAMSGSDVPNYLMSDLGVGGANSAPPSYLQRNVTQGDVNVTVHGADNPGTTANEVVANVMANRNNLAMAPYAASEVP